MKLCSVAALLAGSALWAQDQTAVKEPAYVRRFSAGATLSVLPRMLLGAKTINNVTTTPAVDSTYKTDPLLKRRVGYGATVQVALTERFAVASGAFVRWVGYKMTSDIFEGTDNPNTTVDERRHTLFDEDTRARLYDIPVLVRYYGKDRHDEGPRWFVELGGTLRKVTNIKTSTSRALGAEPSLPFSNTPATPAHKLARGITAGAGLQLIDPLGIRVIPQVRYTRWMTQTFNTFSTIMRRDQVEIMLSLGF